MAVRQPFQGNGIVEIAGVLAVNGDDHAIAKVSAALEVIRTDDRGQGLCGGQGLRGMGLNDAVFPQDDRRVDTRRVDVAQHFGHFAARGLPDGGVPRDGDHHHLARVGVLRGPAGNHHIVDGAAVEGHHVGLSAAVALEAPHHFGQQRARSLRRGLPSPPRKRVEMAPHQHQRAVGQPVAQVSLEGRALETGNPQQAHEFVGPGWVRESLAQQREIGGLGHAWVSRIWTSPTFVSVGPVAITWDRGWK